MNVRISIVFMLLAGVALVGCRRDPHLDIYLDSMNSEKRLLEDQVYELQYEYEVKLQELESLRQENKSLREGANQDGGVAPLIEIPDDSDPSGISSPKIELPIEILPAAKSDQNSLYVPPLDQRVTHIVLNPYLSQGHDFDGKPGDDGVSLVIQPRNADDQFVAVAGTISIVLLDPLAEGEQARVARWDLDAAEVHYRLRTETSRDGGIHLKMQWPGRQPKHSNLRVFVRYTSDDQRNFEAEGDLLIALPGQFSNRWTPRSADSLTSQPRTSTGGISAQAKSFRSVMVPPRKPIPAQGSTGEISTGITDQQEEPSRVSRLRQRGRPSWKPFR